MSRWTIVSRVAGAADIYVDDPELGRTLVGRLWLKDSDQAELAEMFSGAGT